MIVIIVCHRRLLSTMARFYNDNNFHFSLIIIIIIINGECEFFSFLTLSSLDYYHHFDWIIDHMSILFTEMKHEINITALIIITIELKVSIDLQYFKFLKSMHHIIELKLYTKKEKKLMHVISIALRR